MCGFQKLKYFMFSQENITSKVFETLNILKKVSMIRLDKIVHKIFLLF